MGYYDKAIKEREESLSHHGILGQKWGVRRFQNRDGSLTAAGKARVGGNSSKKHNFVKKDESINRRKESLDSVLRSWGSTAASAALGGAVGATTGNAVVAIVGAGVMATPTAVVSAINTAKFVSYDIKAKKADKKEKQFEEERSQNPVDKKTGFHKKTKEMSSEEDMERVNPAYKNWDENTKSNCVLCTMTMELRRRGYDVQANKATSGYTEDLIKDWFTGAKPKQQEGSMSDIAIMEMAKKNITPKIDKEKQKELIRNTINEIESQKDGARGAITITWNGTASGHSMAYANENGKTVIYDTQSNTRYEGKDLVKFLEKTSQISVTRLDNCDLNLKYIKEVAK